MRAQEGTGEHRRAQDSPGEPRRAQESPGEHRRSAQAAQESTQQCTGPRRTVRTEHAVRAGECAAGQRDLKKSPRRVGESEIFKNNGHGAQARATGASKRTTARRRDTSQFLYILKKQTARRRDQFFGVFMTQEKPETL